MKLKLSVRFCVALLALFALTVFVASAQTQRKRPSRRATSPVPQRTVRPAPTPLPAEPSVVRTAEDVAAQEEAEAAPRRRTTTSRARRNAAEQQQQSEEEQLRKTVTTLTQTVTRLSDELSEIKGEQRMLVELERLTRAEQRAETLRAQLRDVTDKEFLFQDRLAQIEQEIQPDAIERRSALIGSLNPSAVREQIRLSLERERERIRRQLELLTTSRTRLESAVASADQEVDRIKARIEAAEQLQRETNATGVQAAQPTPTPTPTPTDNPRAEPPDEE